MAGYSDLLKTSGVARIISSQLVARFPFGMLSLVLLLHVERIFDSYGLAGTVLACYSIGQAISGPTSSRLMGRFGMRPVLIVTLLVCLITVSVLGLTNLPLWVYLSVGFIAGLATPPIQPAVRTVYPKMVPAKMLTPLFSLDATAQEIIWVVGPVVATFTATGLSTSIAVYLCVIIMLIGGIWFISSPELGQVRIPRSRSKMGMVLKKPPVLLATIIGFLLIGGAAAIEAGVVATFGHDGAEAGIVLAVFSVGSLIGGLALGHRPIGKWALTLRMLVIFVGVAAAAFWMDFWWLSATLLIAGLGIAPVLAVIFSNVAATVKFSETAEAYGWAGTGQLIGAALGSAAAGFMIDGFSSTGAFIVATVFIFIGTALPAVTIRWQPDLRAENLGPHPDTEPIIV